MDWSAFDERQVELLKNRRYSDAESELTELYEQAQRERNSELLEQSISRLAHFYSLPFVENLQRAAFFFAERERYFPSDYSRLQTALFRFYCLDDPALALEKLRQITDIRGETHDVSTYFSATALKGQSLLRLSHNAEVAEVLSSLIELTKTHSASVVQGDALNLITELMTRGELLDRCRELLQAFLKSPLDKETKERATAIYRSMQGRAPR